MISNSIFSKDFLEFFFQIIVQILTSDFLQELLQRLSLRLLRELKNIEFLEIFFNCDSDLVGIPLVNPHDIHA